MRSAQGRAKKQSQNCPEGASRNPLQNRCACSLCLHGDTVSLPLNRASQHKQLPFLDCLCDAILVPVP
jgi:hypothetical protein